MAAIAKTELGDRRPAAGGHWLKTLRSLDGLKVWWAATAATEEYEDALLAAFAAGVPEADLAALPDRSVVLPVGEPAQRDGRAQGDRPDRLPDRRAGRRAAAPDTCGPRAPTATPMVPGANRPRRNAVRPAPRAPRAAKAGAAAAERKRRPPAPVVAAEALTPDGEARLRAELDELTQVKRPQVIARIRTAKEHGDLKENSEYHAAREEQSFLEGRVQAIEARLRSAVIVEAPAAGSRVGLGSVVTVDDDGETVAYTIVGADESDPPRGRISSSSPVGRALVGRDTGDYVVVVTPAGEQALPDPGDRLGPSGRPRATARAA